MKHILTWGFKIGSNGIVTETAIHNSDRKLYNEGYDRIFKAECCFCGEIGSKREMSQLLNGSGETSYSHAECVIEECTTHD